jgi:cobyrinic acid a,c-diamide synthase
MAEIRLSRLMLAGTGGDCGKTLVTLGLAAAWRRQGIAVAPFKKGPDYIDPAWLSLASGARARNLDAWMMGPQAVLDSFIRNASRDGISLVEANRGLHDGEDSAGTHSSAELSKLLKIPVILIIPAFKVTRTAAAIALGLQMLDREVMIGGIILNRLGTARQETVIRSAIEHDLGLPVLGAIPRIPGELLSSRHLGLVTPEEHSQNRKVIAAAADIISNSVDLQKMKSVAENAPPLPWLHPSPGEELPSAEGLKIGYFRSPAFTFYYPENLEVIDRHGAVKIPVDPLSDSALPELDALYIGGGFPETHAARLSSNESFRDSVAQAAQKGLPIWAECGGLIFLCSAIHWEGNRYPMSGVFPMETKLDPKPAGHGYEEVFVDQPNPFLAEGTTLRGHEFHYSRLTQTDLSDTDTIFRVDRGTGIGNKRDGLIWRNVVAGYLHLHALASREWFPGLLRAAANFAGPGPRGRSVSI